jgi:hypothetical protein
VTSRQIVASGRGRACEADRLDLLGRQLLGGGPAGNVLGVRSRVAPAMDRREYYAVSAVVQQSQGPRKVPTHVAEGVVPDNGDMPQSRGRVGPQRRDLCCRLLGGERCPRPGSDRSTGTRSGLRETSRQPSRPAPRCQGESTRDQRNCERRRCQPAERRGIEGHGPSLSGRPPQQPSNCRVSRAPRCCWHICAPVPLCRDVTQGLVLSAYRARIDASARVARARRYVSVHSIGHLRPLNTASAPAQYCICARSTLHLRPLGPTYAPSRPNICAHSALHLRPLGPGGSQPRRRASQAAASLKSESAVPAVTDVTTESARGYEPRNRTSSDVRRNPISASPTRASAT